MLERILNQWKALLAVVSTLLVIMFGVWKLDDRHASAGAVREMNQEFTIFKAEDRLNNVQKRMWDMEARFGYEPETMPEGVKKEYWRLSSEKELLLLKLEKMYEND